jgi:hypothetical protein
MEAVLFRLQLGPTRNFDMNTGFRSFGFFWVSTALFHLCRISERDPKI